MYYIDAGHSLLIVFDQHKLPPMRKCILCTIEWGLVECIKNLAIGTTQADGMGDKRKYFKEDFIVCLI